MEYRLLCLAAILCVVVAEPIRGANEIVYIEKPSYEVLAKPDTSSLVLNIITTLMGYKSSALSIGVCVIDWVVSNFTIILMGAAAVLGFCKVTGKCSTDIAEYVPVDQIKNFATSENIQTAERFFFKAVERYAAKKKRST